MKIERIGRWLVLAVTLVVPIMAVGLVFALSIASGSTQPALPRLFEDNSHTVWHTASDTSVASPYTTLVTVRFGGPISLDPHTFYDIKSGEVAEQVYETLLTHRREDPIALVPQLATAWDISSDVGTYTFNIRSGVTFHAGGTLEPHDVAYSLWRGLLQDNDSGPTRILLDTFFGIYDIDDLPGDDATKCQAVKDAITYDNVDGTVTFHLSRSFAPFLEVLTIWPSSVLDQDWMASGGEWGGDCANWRDFVHSNPEDSILYSQANGTGPFRLAYWITDEVKLVRNDDYWRQEPAWVGGPYGSAALEVVAIKTVANWETRRDMLIDGSADLIDVPTPNFSELQPFVWGVYRGFEDQHPTLVHPTGTVRLFIELPKQSNTPMMFCYDITNTSPYIGSGTFDGQGIPVDFFADLHVRKAFNYAMDWTAVINDIYAGEGVQSRGPIPAGMLGYSDSQPIYSHSLTQSAQEFQQAWGGQVWSRGFSLTLAYNEGNVARRRIAEILAQNLNSITDVFHVEVISVTWPDLLSAWHSRTLPMYASGWLEDYHHPHNWVRPFLDSGYGYYGDFQSFPSSMATQFETKIDQCVRLTDLTAAQTCYEELQNMAYVSATAMFGVQTLARHYERMEVRGFYYNPPGWVPDYYSLSKSALPAVETVDETVNNTLQFFATTGARVALYIPAGAVTAPTTVVFTPQDPHAAPIPPSRYALGGVVFDLDAYRAGDPIPSFVFEEVVTLTLDYSEADAVGVNEPTLALYRWIGSEWEEIGSREGETYTLDVENNRLAARLGGLGKFGTVGIEIHRLFLPLVLKSNQATHMDRLTEQPDPMKDV